MYQVSSQWIAVLYPEKTMVGVTSPPTPSSAITISKYVGGNSVNWTHWANWYIELQAFCKLFYTYFYFFYLPRTKSFVLKTEPYFTFFGQPVVARRVLWIRVCSSFHPSNFVRKFSRDWPISFFLKLSMVLGPHVFLCVTEPDFLKKIFFPKNGKNRPKMSKK